jgi:uncharacterized Zn finger protein (UPF0148 family)
MVKCVTCRKKMSEDFSGIIHYVKGKPICPNCWKSADKKEEEKEGKTEISVEKEAGKSVAEAKRDGDDKAKKDLEAKEAKEVERKVKEDLEKAAEKSAKAEIGGENEFFF